MDAIIIDDEATARESLKGLLAIFCPEVRVTYMLDSYKAGLDVLQTTTPDIVFLDVSLGKETGFDLLDVLVNKSTAVIFVTASEQHSLRAFDYAATDYLLKPVSGLRLQKAVEKVTRKGAGWIRSEIEDLKNAIAVEKETVSGFISAPERGLKLSTQKICYIFRH
ncbi:LytR/AlgR family response regulator transcription factor [Niabella hibiscisoli]|uniref:LytR/AlgR family response regulator transcription factor n=1 Tax=Niabella hibiscisoli TaxID=1825928 RepID=UPI001F0F2228|nr:response regulator [Niabella hibiscisoli]MCH5718328.1 response regulator [Niabella hibiscisoli]